MKHHFDRSGLETYQSCPRKYYYNRLALRGVEGHPGGVVSAGKKIALVFGSAIHAGWEVGLKGGGVDEALAAAMGVWKEVDPGDFNLGPKSEEDPDRKAQQILELECMVQGYTVLLVEWVLKDLKAGWEIEAVERDSQLTLAQVDGEEIVFNIRPDAILKAKDGVSGRAPLSVKTTSWWGRDEEFKFRNDLQGLTEGWWTLGQGEDEALHQVMQATIVKGSRKERGILVPGVGKVDVQLHGNPLGVAYVRREQDLSGELVGSEWAWSYYVQKPGNKSGWGVLGKEWVPVSVAMYPGGPAQWARDLLQGRIQPEVEFDPGKILILQPPWSRGVEEQQDAAEEVYHQCVRIVRDARRIGELEERVRDGGGDQARRDYISGLNQMFPRSRGACSQFGGYQCEYGRAGCLSGGGGDLFNILGDGKFQLRVPHHGAEGED